AGLRRAGTNKYIDESAESTQTIPNDDASGMEEVMGTMRRRHWHLHRFPLMRDFRRAMHLMRRSLPAARR
ncbi:MAG TPA: hypothetical protein VGN81_13775, partial [Pseudonocardiaceae bacterium]